VQQDVALAWPSLSWVEPARRAPFAVLASHGHEQRVVKGITFPTLDGVLVEAKEDAFAPVLNDGHPGGRALSLDRGNAAGVVGFTGADSGEPTQCRDDP
jgi:hypothetical protein